MVITYLGVGVGRLTLIATNCCLAMVMAGIILGLLSHLGVLARPGNCLGNDTYSTCALLQDFRMVLSFLLGILVCSVITKKQEGDDLQELLLRGRGQRCSSLGLLVSVS